MLLEDGELLKFYFRMEATTRTFTRRVFSIGDWLAKVGGIQKSLMFFGMILAGFFDDKLMKAQVIKKIYNFRK